MRIPWWQWWPFQAWRCVGMAESADEIPVRLPRHGAALVGSPGRFKWVGFDCPCGSGHRVLLNADPGRQPAWQVILSSRGRLSLIPSVDQRDGGRRCHYVVRNGKVIWVKDTEQ